MIRLPVAGLLVALALSTGCSSRVVGEATMGSTDPSVSRTSPKSLPFTPRVKDRTNDRNNGSTFEPCSEYTETELRLIGVVPESIEDAAKTSGANYRGCHWEGADYTDRYGGTLYSQIVGMKMSLAEYKRYMSMVPWQHSRIVHGRELAVAAERNYCFAAFASEEAIVVTRASATNPSPGNTVECEKAVAFASLALTKAPR